MRVTAPSTGVTRWSALRPRNSTKAPGAIARRRGLAAPSRTRARRREVHVAGVRVAHPAHILERAAALRRLDHQRDRERGVVEMPAELLPGRGIVQVDGCQRIGVCVQRRLAQHGAQGRAKIRRVIEPAQGRIRGHLIVADAALRRDDIAVAGVVGGVVPIRRRQIDVVGLGAEIRLVLPRLAFAANAFGRRGQQEVLHDEHAGLGQRRAARGPQGGVGQRIALRIDDGGERRRGADRGAHLCDQSSGWSDRFGDRPRTSPSVEQPRPSTVRFT